MYPIITPLSRRFPMKHEKFPKHLKHIATAAAASLILLTLPMTLHAASAGSAEDPFITLSYVNATLKNEIRDSVYEEVYENVRQEIWDKMYKELKEEITAEVKASINSSSTGSSAAQNSEYEVIHLQKGQKLNSTGVCEIILRSGSAEAYVDKEENRANNIGLSDCTDGSEILNGQAIPMRHLLIIPRGDGRGASVTSAEAYFMVRGDYEIVT